MMAAAEHVRIDCHLHVWADRDPRFPYCDVQENNLHGDGPELEQMPLGPVEVLLAAQRECNVVGAMIVQPKFHGFDHAYVAGVLKSHGPRFQATLLLNGLTLGPEAAVAQVKQLHAESGFRGVRLKPGLCAGGLLGATSRAVVACCAELGLVVGLLCGVLDEAENIAALCAEYPACNLLVDHFGGPPEGPSFQKLLGLSKFPNFHVKCSGWADDPPAYMSATLELLKAYGADRLMFGTDFPVAELSCQQQWKLFDQFCADSLSEEETAALAGGTIARLFGFDTAELLELQKQDSSAARL